MQCCGDPFEVGSAVSWTVAPPSDRDFLAAVLGTEGAAAIMEIEDHHDTGPVSDRPLAGLVRSGGDGLRWASLEGPRQRYRDQDLRLRGRLTVGDR